jgi:nitrogen fixation NifU-like protein
MTIRLEGETIADIGHRPNGCTYTVACASAVSVLACGRSVEDALQLQPEDVEHELGGLPEDHRHCARLAVNTLGDAIADAYRPIDR